MFVFRCSGVTNTHYWTPSRCAKILIVAFAPGLLANLYIYRKERAWK